MVNKIICIAGKNSISIAGLSYVLEHYSFGNSIYALCDVKDEGIDSWQPSYKKFATENGVKIVELDELYDVENLVFISLEYFKLINPNKFKTGELFNIHFSLLPAYRGMYTSAHPILNEEKFSGCTFHCIDSGIDTGDVISQIKFEILQDDNCNDVYDKYLVHGIVLMHNTIGSLIENNFSSQLQPSIGSSYYSKRSIDYENLKIDLAQNSDKISKNLRAYTFRDYQLPKINGFEIFGHVITDKKSKVPAGNIVQKNKDYFVISTNDFDMKLFIDNFESLVDAVSENHLQKVISILASNCHAINEKNESGWTPLIISTFNGYNDITYALLKVGADPNKANPKGTTPLMYAKDYALITGDLYGLEILLNWGAHTNLKDIYRKSIFDYLDEKSNYFEDVYDLLVNHKANKNSQGN
ncbi:formyltransferase family protein [Planktomarina sp.]|nr:formyltransferase family protein [Planktomarina sp.]